MPADGLHADIGLDAPFSIEARFDCGPGELLALVGPSGGGKTTILRMVAGLRRPRRGLVRCNAQVWFDSVNATDLPTQARAIGMMFQSYALFPHLTVFGNIETALGHRPAHERRVRAEALLATVNLSGLGLRRAHELSGGQQQRVALARALARDPQVLLLDEPFAAVDQVTRRKLRAELARLRAHLAMPIVLVTHDLDEARMLADRMCIVNHGRTLQTGPPDAVMAHPATAQIARLVDHPNVFAGTVVAHGQEPACTRLRWRDRELEAAPQPAYAPGTAVSWVIPAENVILHRRDRPSRGERENPIDGAVHECVVLGESTLVSMRIDGSGDERLQLQVPTHVARRNGIERNARIRVSLLAAAIHLMPAE